MEDVPQPGSLEAEAGVFCSTFDQTGTRLITGGADKTIKVRSHSHSLPSCVIDVVDGYCFHGADSVFLCCRSTRSSRNECVVYLVRFPSRVSGDAAVLL
jgi:hypothetical protein